MITKKKELNKNNIKIYFYRKIKKVIMLWSNEFENKNIKINQQTFWYNIKKK